MSHGWWPAPFAARPREAFAIDEVALTNAMLTAGVRTGPGAAPEPVGGAATALSAAGLQMMDNVCRVECADCPGGEYRMAYTSGLERAAGPAFGRNVCAFVRADATGNAAWPAQGGAVRSMAECTTANSNAYGAHGRAVVASLAAGNLDGRAQCVVTFAPGKRRAEYAAYEAGLRSADLLASQPYGALWTKWDSNDRAINGRPDGFLYRIADRTRMVYGPELARAGDAVTAGAQYDLERRLTVATSNADGYKRRWDTCEGDYKREYSDPGACKDQLAWCKRDLGLETGSNLALGVELGAASNATQAIRDDIARNYVLSTECERQKGEAYSAAYADEANLFREWISRAQCDQRVQEARRLWSD